MTGFDEVLVNYLAAQAQARQQRVEAIWAAMTKRERLLVAEVVVMTNVRARMRAGVLGPPHGPPVEPTPELLHDTIYACTTMDDLYPTVARLERIATRRARKDASAQGNT